MRSKNGTHFLVLHDDYMMSVKLAVPFRIILNTEALHTRKSLRPHIKKLCSIVNKSVAYT